MLVMIAALAQAVATVATLDLRWLVTLESPPAATPAYDVATAYVPLREHGVLAIDLDRGSVRWQRDLTTTVTPAVGGDSAYVAVGEGVEALEVATGQTRWQTMLSSRVTSVTWDTGWLLCAGETGDLAALRGDDGEVMWRSTLGAQVVAGPAPGLDRVYVGLADGRLVALDVATGRHAWERTLPGRITGLSSFDDQLIAGTTDNAVYSLSLSSGSQRWRWRVGGDVTGTAASDDRHVYFVSRDNMLRAVDRGSGNLRWIVDLSTRPAAGPQLFAGVVLVPLAAAVALFEPANGSAIGTVAVSGELGTSPHVRLDVRPTAPRLVALTRDGRLQGFGARYEAPPAPLETLPGQPVVP
ncbi:MAG: PQQ-binding-like beta-propeller repeat protein [Acidobacteriota bacterium]|nr:PQQ-binding-like beta-propeller repeat protein [Acidobacteriota bacterium]